MRTLVICILTSALSFAVGWYCHAPEQSILEVKVPVAHTVVDTVVVRQPEVMVIRKLDTCTIAASAFRINPYEKVQKLYCGQGYRAYVSGYSPNLDSLVLFNSHTTIQIPSEVKKEKIFSVDLQAGIGLTPKGLQPYVGLGVSMKIVSF